MPDKEKVLQGLECCIRRMEGERVCDECPYDDDFNCLGCSIILRQAIALLREQEPLTIHDPGAICPNCKWPLYPEDHPHYCGNCGREVKWDA